MAAFRPRIKFFINIPALGIESHQVPESRTVNTDAFTRCLKVEVNQHYNLQFVVELSSVILRLEKKNLVHFFC